MTKYMYFPSQDDLFSLLPVMVVNIIVFLSSSFSSAGDLRPVHLARA
jgi:hypothetical protein